MALPVELLYGGNTLENSLEKSAEAIGNVC
jgi:hypothetical protein